MNPAQKANTAQRQNEAQRQNGAQQRSQNRPENQPQLWWQPRPGELLDVALPVGLLAAALAGFERTYGGTRYLLAGLVGVVLGLVISVVAERVRAPLVAVVAVTVVVFFLVGGAVALNGPSSGGLLPGANNLAALADGATHGWVDLLTVLPPVGRTGNLLTIPYLLGLLGAVSAYWPARRFTAPWPPLVPPAAVLALSILLGTGKPASVVVQGLIFAVLSLGWLAARARRRETPLAGGSAAPGAHLRAVGGAIVVLAVAAAGAAIIGPNLPGARARDRLVLRDYVQPPFDPHQYPSPLVSLRKYLIRGKSGDRYLGDEVLFTITGAPPGSLVSLATMDTYDGTVWSVAGGAAPATGTGVGGSGYFQRVGQDIPTAAPRGTPIRMSVTIGKLGGVWMPTVGSTTSLRFTGAGAGPLSQTFRYNLATDGAVAGTSPSVSPRGLVAGDSYALSAVVPPTAYAQPRVRRRLLEAASPVADAQPALASVQMDSIKARAQALIGDASTPYAKATALAAGLRRGTYSDGERGQPPSDPGHYAARLSDMLASDDAMVGDAEQYAALMAVMARQAQLPARVVVGARVPQRASGPLRVSGVQLTAWVEVGLQRVGWVPLFPTPDNTVQKPRPAHPEEIKRINDPPRTAIPPPLDADALAAGQPKVEPRKPAEAGLGSGLPLALIGFLLLPGLLLGGALGLILALKRRRRRRRMRTGAATTRVAAGWAEVIDQARDAGRPIPARGTRPEVAEALGTASALALAWRADTAVFGPGDPTDTEVAAFWADVATARRDLTAPLNRWGRFKAAVNLTSLRQE